GAVGGTQTESPRRKGRQKRGGGLARLDLEDAELACRMPPEELLALDEALARLAAEDPVKARLVELRFFAGLSLDEASKALGVSAVTAKRHWRYARARLHRAIAGAQGPGTSPRAGRIFLRRDDPYLPVSAHCPSGHLIREPTMPAPANARERLFHAAAELTDPGQRAAFLDAACAGDAGLR